MPSHGKNYQNKVKLVDKTKPLSIEEAIKQLRQVTFAKFDETVGLDVRLGVDPRQADQQVRGTVALPHGTGKKVRVAVFVRGEKRREAEEAGADIVGDEDLVKRVQEGFTDFDAAIATPDMMREVGKLGRVLGPRGLMPNPKTGTVTQDVANAIQELKAGRVEYRLDKTGNVHVAIGKLSFSDNQLVDNARALLDALAKARPASAKGTYMRTITLSSTMSPGLRLEYSSAA
jgi:large subunit ribosomal protein L1